METTALVFKNTVFFILKGNHKAHFQESILNFGLQGCIDYFIDHVTEAHQYSEHLCAVGLSIDPFKLAKTLLEIIGQGNVDRIRQACEA